jgi:hypothetical protein
MATLSLGWVSNTFHKATRHTHNLGSETSVSRLGGLLARELVHMLVLPLAPSGSVLVDL